MFVFVCRGTEGRGSGHLCCKQEGDAGGQLKRILRVTPVACWGSFLLSPSVVCDIPTGNTRNNS